MSTFARLAAAAAAAVWCSAAAPDSATSRGEALFAAAREARSQSGYAHYSVYFTVVRYRNRGVQFIRTWSTAEDMRRRLVHTHAISAEEAAHPHVPHGTNFGFQIVNGATRVLNAEPDADPIGQLTLAVDQDFGLALNAPAISAANDMSAVSSGGTNLPHIGRTGTVARSYDVTDAGDTVLDGTTVHHLQLRPLREPRRYRLRELWTDVKTSVPVRAIVAGIGNHDPVQQARWQIDFVQLQGGTYIARQTALDPLDYGEAGILTGVTISFERLRAANKLDPEEQIGYSDSVGITDP